MPRQPRRREAVIPTASLVASAVHYQGKVGRIYQPQQDWQREAYRHYGINGMARYAANYYGNALSRAVLSIGKRDKKGVVKPSTTGAAFQRLTELFNGKDGQAQMLKALGVHLTVAGECFLVGRAVEGEDTWEIVSILEMRVNGDRWSIDYGDGMLPVVLNDKDVVIRIWNPNPARRIEADSPFRSLLSVLAEMEWLQRHTFAQLQSRIAGAGILWMPQGVSFPPPVDKDGNPVEVPGGDAMAFMTMLGQAMAKAIEDPSAASALVPIIAMLPDESLGKQDLMHFWSELDAQTKEMRQEAGIAFALGMDLPPEKVLGMGSNTGTSGGNSNGVSHWGAWQIDEDTIKMHIEPMLELVANALTIGYIRPLTEDPSDVVLYSTEGLKLRPDRSKESIELHVMGALKREVMLRENGFDPDTDMMTEEEYAEHLLRKIASGSSTPEQVAAAAAELGVVLPAGPSQAAPRQARPDPSLEDHPTRPRTPEESPYTLTTLLAASEPLVFRALERAGNRIKNKVGVKVDGVPAYEMHTLYQTNGEADAFLDDAWSCAPQVLAGLAEHPDKVISTLDAYCRVLMAERSPHTRDRLRDFLQAAA